MTPELSKELDRLKAMHDIHMAAHFAQLHSAYIESDLCEARRILESEWDWDRQGIREVLPDVPSIRRFVRNAVDQFQCPVIPHWALDS